MNLFENLVLREIHSVNTSHFARGETSQITRRQWYGLSFCVDGQITYKHAGQTYVSSPGHATLLPMGQTYTLHCDRAGAFPVINFLCDHFPCEGFVVLPLSNAAALLDDYEYIRKLFVFARNRLKVFSLFYSILDRLPRQQGETFYILAPAIRLLEQHIGNPELDNEMLAREAGISEVYFRQLFLRHYGVTPRQYILDVRMHKARQLLTDGALTVAETAAACGFGSAYHFCRSFKARTGETPGEYRRKHRGI